MSDFIKRNWKTLAPKLVAFLATGLTASALIGAGQLFGLTISAELSTLLVAGVSSVAAFIQRDNLLNLAPGQFSLKVITFMVTGASATGIVVFANALGLNLDDWSWLIALVLTAAGSILGYQKADQDTLPLEDTQPMSVVS